MVIAKEQDNNICCPHFRIGECEETSKHCHLICGFSNTPLSNRTAKEVCIGENFRHCINISEIS